MRAVFPINQLSSKKTVQGVGNSQGRSAHRRLTPQVRRDKRLTNEAHKTASQSLSKNAKPLIPEDNCVGWVPGYWLLVFSLCSIFRIELMIFVPRAFRRVFSF